MRARVRERIAFYQATRGGGMPQRRKRMTLRIEGASGGQGPLPLHPVTVRVGVSVRRSFPPLRRKTLGRYAGARRCIGDAQFKTVTGP